MPPIHPTRPIHTAKRKAGGAAAGVPQERVLQWQAADPPRGTKWPRPRLYANGDEMAWRRRGIRRVSRAQMAHGQGGVESEGHALAPRELAAKAGRQQAHVSFHPAGRRWRPHERSPAALVSGGTGVRVVTRLSARDLPCATLPYDLKDISARSGLLRRPPMSTVAWTLSRLTHSHAPLPAVVGAHANVPRQVTSTARRPLHHRTGVSGHFQPPTPHTLSWLPPQHASTRRPRAAANTP